MVMTPMNDNDFSKNQDTQQKLSNLHERFQTIANKNKTLEQENTDEWTRRNIAQYGARAAETIAGLPGNLKKAVTQTKDFLEEYLSPNGQKIADAEKKAFGSPEKGSIHELIMNPPTSSELRENVTPLVSEFATGDKNYLEPKNKKEKFAGELTGDITSFFLPGTGQMNLMTRLGAPIVGNLAKEGVKYLGADEKTAENTKLGFMLATTLAGTSDPGRFAGQRIGQAKSMVPANATIDATNLANRLIPLYNRTQRGLGVPSKSRAVQGMQDLAGQVQNNRMSLHSLMDARDNVNEWIAEAGGWDVPANTRDATVRNLNELKTQIIDTVNENLATRFPEAADLYRTGYEAAAVTHRSNAISNFIEKYFGRKVASAGAKVLFPAVAGGAAVLPKTAATAAAVYPFYKTGQVLYRVGNSPTLTAYYQSVIHNAAIGNAPAMIKSMEKLDKELSKQEKKEGIKNPDNLQSFKQKFKKTG
jgi:hypothetical protein